MILQLKRVRSSVPMGLVIYAALFTIAFWGFSSPTMAGKSVTLEGTIQGSRLRAQ